MWVWAYIHTHSFVKFSQTRIVCLTEFSKTCLDKFLLPKYTLYIKFVYAFFYMHESALLNTYKRAFLTQKISFVLFICLQHIFVFCDFQNGWLFFNSLPEIYCPFPVLNWIHQHTDSSNYSKEIRKRINLGNAVKSPILKTAKHKAAL